jgi:hypothetical protein
MIIIVSYAQVNVKKQLFICSFHALLAGLARDIWVSIGDLTLIFTQGGGQCSVLVPEVRGRANSGLLSESTFLTTDLI